MAASLLARGRTVLSSVPRIAHVFTIAEVLEHLGARVDFEGDEMSIDTSDDITGEAPYDLARKMRASINVLGPMLARLGYAGVAMPGDCNIGTRTVKSTSGRSSRWGRFFSSTTAIWAASPQTAGAAGGVTRLWTLS